MLEKGATRGRLPQSHRGPWANWKERDYQSGLGSEATQQEQKELDDSQLARENMNTRLGGARFHSLSQVSLWYSLQAARALCISLPICTKYDKI